MDLAAKIITDDIGYLYTTGRYKAEITFGSVTLTGSNTDAFITKFNADGNTVWAKGISGQGNDEEADIDYKDGSIAFIATTVGNVTMDGYTINGLGNLDICIGKMDIDGTVLWTRLYGGSSNDEGSGVTLLNGSIYFNGTFKTTANFDGFQLISEGLWDIVTGKIDNSITTDISRNDVNIPGGFSLSQNYPNPFNPSTNFQFRIANFPEGTNGYRQAGTSLLTLKIYDVLGNEIATLVNEEKEPGNYEIKFNASNLSSGIYFYKLTSGNFSETKKMTLLK